MAIVRLDKVHATYNGNLESVKFVAAQTNGVIAVLNGLAAGEREVQNAIAPTDALTQEIVLVSAPEVMYDPRKQGLKDFVIDAGTAVRAYHLAAGDIITITDDLIDGVSVLGQYLVPVNGEFKLNPAADLTGATRFAAKVIEKTTLGAEGSAATAFQVVKA
jgi:hypothetical protein